MVTNYPLVARRMVADFIKSEGTDFNSDEAYVVWFCYILGGWKALVSTTIEDNRYYEVTHNAQKNQTYLDVYVKKTNIQITHGDFVSFCTNHNPVQHRDGKEPWCKACGMNAAHQKPYDPFLKNQKDI